LFYLAQTQIGTTKKSQISDLQNQKEELEMEIERLEVGAAAARSIGNLSESLDSLDMIPTENINYIIETD